MTSTAEATRRKYPKQSADQIKSSRTAQMDVGFLSVLFCFVFNCTAWVLCCTILLPFTLLIMFSLRCRRIWFSFLYTKIFTPYLNPKWRRARSDLFKMMDWGRDVASKTILEIGIADGSNLPFYPPNTHLTGLDANPFFEEHLKATVKSHPNVHLEKVIIDSAEKMAGVPDNSVDVVVETFLLCSANHPDLVLKEIKRILVPGGKLLFLEHVLYPENSLAYFLQKMMVPLWVTYFAGCNFKNPENIFKSTGFAHLHYQRSHSELFFHVRPIFMGVATK